MTISANPDSQAQAPQPNDAAALNACADWMVAAIPANDRWQHDGGQVAAIASNIVEFKSRAGEERPSGPQAASPSPPDLPKCVAEADRLAPSIARRARHPLTAPLLIGASLLCHALALAYFASHAPPAIAIGEKPVLAELVTGTQTASGFSGEAAADSVAAQSAQAGRDQPRNEPHVEPDRHASQPDEMAAPVAQAKEPPATQAVMVDHANEVAKPLPRRPEPKASADVKPKRSVAREKRDGTKHAALTSPASSPDSMPASVAASQAARQSASASATNYAGQVARHLLRFKRYPPEARARGQSGTASVAFSVNGAGNAQGVRLVRSSGHASLDQEAVAMVQRASPFPPPPNGRAGPFTVPANFRAL